MEWLQGHYIDIMAVLWSVDQLLKTVAPLTPWKMDDNVADWVGKTLARFLPKKK